MPYIDAKPDLEYLAHFGVKGMKWGVRKKRDEESVFSRMKGAASLAINDRRSQNYQYKKLLDKGKAQRKSARDAKKRQKQLKDAQRSWDRQAAKNFSTVHNKVAERSNGPNGMIAKLNRKYERAGWDFRLRNTDPKTAIAYEKYIHEYEEKYSKMYVEELVALIGERPK